VVVRDPGDYLGLRHRFNIGGGNAMPWESSGQIETFITSPPVAPPYT
jgi:hypothetical protein